MDNWYYTDAPKSSYKYALLVTRLNPENIRKAYIDDHVTDDYHVGSICVLGLYQKPQAKKTPVADMVTYVMDELIPAFKKLSLEFLIVTDAEYFKVLTKLPKADAHLGYVVDCVFGPWKVVYVPAHQAIFYDPGKIRERIRFGLDSLQQYVSGNYQTPGKNIINFAEYPRTLQDIKKWLHKLWVDNKPLTCDIEAFSLKHYSAGIGTIAFAWNEHEGIAFPVDFLPEAERIQVRAWLREFFDSFRQRLIFHSIGYDVMVLIYNLYMDHLIDTEGLLTGLEKFMSENHKWDDTKLIAYLATNSCAGNKLSLKDLAQAYTGNYAFDDEINDITKIPLEELLEYNLKDCLATWYVHNLYYPRMINDDQEEIYDIIFKPAMVDIIQMQLTGLPVNMARAEQIATDLQAESDKIIAQIMQSPLVQNLNFELESRHIAKRNATLKTKRIKFGDEPQVFNPNSNSQQQILLYEMLKLPVLNRTATKQPSTDGDTLKALLNHTKDPQIIDLLENMVHYAALNILLVNFLPNILQAQKGPDGWHYLFGNFNLGGTLSARLSSSSPNLQNLPSTGKGDPIKLKYADMIKTCFEAPPGWVFAGLDFDSLEDKISALTTKDPNKLAVYQGHQVFEIIIDGQPRWIREDSVIVYQGQQYTGKAFYEYLSAQ